jgi:ADP-ribose pyrophosphatase YjhB (NUDIX family)
MNNILARAAPPGSEEPSQHKRVAARSPKRQSDGPLLDLDDAAVRRMIKLAKKRGFVTDGELDEILPPGELTVEQIENVISELSQIGITVLGSVPHGPLLDLTDATVGRMIRIGQRRGYVTYDELDEVLPPEELTVEQIEDVLRQLSGMGITVRPLNEAPLQDRNVATRDPERQSEGPSFYRYRADPTVSRMIKLAKKRGYVTYAELKEVLHPERFTSEQIREVLRQLSKLGIDGVVSEEDQESLLGRAMHEALLMRALPQDDITEKEPEGGTLIPLVLQTLNDQSLSEGEKRAFALGLLRGLASRGE